MIETPKPMPEVNAGQIWFHQGRVVEPYVVRGVFPNPEGYERTGQITAPPIVVYEQDYDGEVAKKGTIWARPLPDFLGVTEINGKLVPNFVLKVA